MATRLVGTARRRAQDSAEIRTAAALVDYPRLAEMLAGARMLALLASRLAEAAPESVPASFRDAAAEALAHGRRRATLFEQVTRSLVESLESEGLAVVALKGPHLAERVHGDPGMRLSNDIDLLVLPEDFRRAISVLERSGYRTEGRAPWVDGLPLFEESLRSDDSWRPSIDLHWRLHWYEERFSRDFVRRSRPDDRGIRAPTPLDELAALLLFWSRDGLLGLRHPADIGAWWDRHGDGLSPHALDDIALAHPALAPALTAAALRAEQAAGVPASRLLSRADSSTRRIRLAARCASAADPASQMQADAEVVLLDGLLTPRGGTGAFLRRHFVLPDAVIGDVYGLPEGAELRRTLRRAYYAARVGGDTLRGTAELVARR